MLRSLLILISVVSGVLSGYLLHSYLVGSLLILLGVSVYIIIDSRLRSNPSNYVLTSRLHIVWPCLILAGISAISATMRRPYPESIPGRIEFDNTGVILDRRTTTMGEQYTVELISVANKDMTLNNCRNLKIYLFASGSHVFSPGDMVGWTSTFVTIKHALPGQPQYLSYDMVRVYEGDVTKTGKEKFHYRNGNLHLIEHVEGLMPMAWEIREAFTIILENSGMSKETTRLLQALLTGRRHGMSPEHLAQFRDAGVAHTLAVSGMHVGILVGILMLLSFPLNIMHGRKWRFFIIAVVAWGFALLTGLQLSTVRSTMMLTLAALAVISERRQPPFSSLCIAVVIILIISPTALWDIGFQLSFACVASLVIFVEPLNPINRRNHKALHVVVASLLTTIVATAATWVITAYYFESMPLHFLSANMIILPLLPFLMALGLLHTAFYGIGFEITIIKESLQWVTGTLFKIIDSLSEGAIDVHPSPYVVWLWLLGIGTVGASIHINLPVARTLPACRPFPQSASSLKSLHPNRAFLMTGVILLLASLILLIVGI